MSELTDTDTMEHLKTEAEAGHAEAQYELASRYAVVREVEENVKLAFDGVKIS